jgi:hypothetical protein
MVAKDMMPWLFVSRKSAWTPFAKVRCEGTVSRAPRPARAEAKRKAPEQKEARAFWNPAGV